VESLELQLADGLRALQQREVIPVGATEAVPVNARVIAATSFCTAGEKSGSSPRSIITRRAMPFSESCLMPIGLSIER